jgi:hypothetical protein
MSAGTQAPDDGVTDNQVDIISLITRNDPKVPDWVQELRARGEFFFADWSDACKAAGHPVCAFTHQPIAGELIYFTQCFSLFPGGEYVPVLASACETREVRGEPNGYRDRPLTTCPNCAARFPGRSRQVSTTRWHWTFDAHAGEAVRACTWWCYHEIVRRRSQARYVELRGDPVRQCASCSQPFTVVRTDQSFCSGACRQRAYRQRKAAP